MNRKNQNRGNETRKKIYSFVKEYMQMHGYAPSYTEIGQAVNLGSTSSVHNQIQIMLENGSLETDLDFNSPRAIRIGKDIWND